MGAQNQNPGGSMPNYNGFLSPQAGNMGPAQAQSPSPSPNQLSQLVQLLTQGQGQQVPPQAAQAAQAQQQVAPQAAQQQQTMQLLQQAMALRAKARGAGQISQPGVRQY